MILEVKGKKIKLIGDPHLGKEFRNGVPLHRRGEREAQQFKELRDQLLTPEVDLIIIMGDLFDKFQVSNEVIMKFVRLTHEVHYEGMPKVYVLMGNHDVTRNVNLISSFDLVSNMNVARNFEFVSVNTLVGTDILLCPYNAFVHTSELFGPLKDLKYSAIFGHWDTISFDDIGHNLLPYFMAENTPLIVTGHEHTPKEWTLPNGTRIIVTGSMLPYSHAEDPEGKLYVTLSVEEFLKDPAAYKDMCVRLLVEDGEELPEQIDVLQLTVKHVTKEQQEEINVSLEEFSMKKLFTEAMTKFNVSEETIEKYWEKYQDVAQS